MTDEEIARQAWLWNLDRWALAPCKGTVKQRQHWAVHGDPSEIARDRAEERRHQAASEKGGGRAPA